MSATRDAGADRRAPLVLAFDTAGSACSVALGRGAAVLAHDRAAMCHGHAEALLPMIDNVMQAAACTQDEIATVAVSVGPGGFTGIRAGLAAAHGLALACGARLAGVTSFAAVTALAPPGDAAILVALDSRRADLYVQLFDGNGAPLGDPAAVMPDDLAGFAGRRPLRVAGDAVEAALAALAGCGDVAVISDSAPDALGVLAAARASGGDPGARPLYLRAPDVSFPKARRGAGAPA